MSLRTFFLTGLLVLTASLPALSEPQLVMVEEDGCIWCARWNKDVADIYPKTPEGQAAPLRRLDIHSDRPDDLTFQRKLFFTPTFVLMVDGKEVSRIEGYPGEDFFWGLFGKMLDDANIEIFE